MPRCHHTDEELFTLDELGYSNIGKRHAVPHGKEDAARRGVAACPEDALTEPPHNETSKLLCRVRKVDLAPFGASSGPAGGLRT